MYGKAYESMYSGSMVGAGCNVFAVWNYVIAKTQRGVIELNPKLLAVILGGTEREIVKAIDYLCTPDKDSRSKLEGGRRMVKDGQFQYRVVNWSEYQTIRDANDLKEYNRRKQQEYRFRQRVKVGGSTRVEKEYEKAMGNGDEVEGDRIIEATLPEKKR